MKIDPTNAVANYMVASYYDKKGEPEKSAAAEYQAQGSYTLWDPER